MAVTDEKDGALATAAVAAAAGIAAYGLRKALSSSGSNGGSTQKSARNRSENEDEYEDDDENETEDDDGDDESSSRAGSLLRKVRGSDSESDSGGSSTLLQTVWDSTSGSIMPFAEQAADAAGKWVAENAPDVVRDELVPRFIEAFQDAEFAG